MPQVSVLMPLYNTQEEHLREAIDSVLAQTYTDFELLLLNDSPQNTRLAEIVAEYKDARIRFSTNEHNIGITDSRNKLIEMAQGEYLAVMDHDDISLPERLAKQVAYLDAHPEVGVVGGRVRNLGERSNLSNYPEEAHQIKLGLMYGCMVPHSCAMIRRSVLMETGIRYEAVFSPAEDYALWVRLISHTELVNLPDVLLRYRLYSSNTSKTQAARMVAATAAIRAYAQTAYPALFCEYQQLATHDTRITFLGIPLLKITGSLHERRYLLFNRIPIARVRYTCKIYGKA